MEFRKIISFGKSSFVISLPKTWIIKNNLKKGDLVSLEEKQENLILQPHLNEDLSIEQSKKIIIEIDGRTLSEIKQEIKSAYICNYRTIIIIGENLESKFNAIEKVIMSFMALEIMEKRPRKIIAKDFLNMKDISPRNIIRKIDLIIRNKLNRIKKYLLNEETPLQENNEDNINRLSILNYRAIYYCLKNPLWSMQIFSLDSISLLNLWNITKALDEIGIQVKNATKLLKKKPFESNKEDLLSSINQMEKLYINIIRVFYNQELSMPHDIIKKTSEICKRLNSFYELDQKLDPSVRVIEKIKQIAINIKKLANCLKEEQLIS